MQPRVSIIMPVYNTGNMLKNTVDSIMKQTFTDYELIIIDDGSKEATAKLCDYLSSLDNRIKVIHKENGGTCAARNLGIEMAKGEYITFCDHDDVYDVNILEDEVHLINQSEKYEMAVVGALHIYDDGKKIRYGQNVSFSNKEDMEKDTARIFKSGILGTVWNILYSRELIGKTRFNEELKKGHEDIIFNIEIYRKASSLIASDRVLYYHYLRKSMSTSAGFHMEAVEALKIANDKIYELCADVIDKIDKNDYVDLQGEYIRTYTTYLVHLDNSFAEFKNKLRGFCYIPVDFRFRELVTHKSKDSLAYYCLRHNKIRVLFYLIKINNHLKRK